jgi:hypothetical protein
MDEEQAMDIGVFEPARKATLRDLAGTPFEEQEPLAGTELNTEFAGAIPDKQTNPESGKEITEKSLTQIT